MAGNTFTFEVAQVPPHFNSIVHDVPHALAFKSLNKETGERAWRRVKELRCGTFTDTRIGKFKYYYHSDLLFPGPEGTLVMYYHCHHGHSIVIRRCEEKVINLTLTTDGTHMTAQAQFDGQPPSSEQFLLGHNDIKFGDVVWPLRQKLADDNKMSKHVKAT